MDIVEQMRSFESDHEPDGWPAIQMKQVSALCDEIERLNSELNTLQAGINCTGYSVDQAVANFKYWMAEYDRLQSIIKTACNSIPMEFSPNEKTGENLIASINNWRNHVIEHTVSLTNIANKFEESSIRYFSGRNKLRDEIDRSQSLLNGMASEVERLQSLLEQERQESLAASCRVAALEMELDSATSIIDAANAQEPLTTIQVLQGYPSVVSRSQCGVKDGTYKVYAHPIPAQQSQVATSDKVLFNGSNGHAGYVIEEQQSPAVVVPDFWREEWKENVMALWVLGRKYNSSIPDDVLDFMRDSMLKMLERSKSPRITEHDAREVALSAWRYWMNNCDRTVDNWIEDEGRDLINKLSGTKNETN